MDLQTTNKNDKEKAPTEIINKLTEQEEKMLVSFQEQSDWYRLHSGSCLCDCINCINARKLRAVDNLPLS
jgi:hypothetical protein